MYTVMRFTAGPGMDEEIAAIGASMNSVRAGVFSGLRKRGDGFSCDVSAEKGWDDHVRDIHRFVNEFSDILKRAILAGAAVTLDVAIEPEDKESSGAVLVLACTQELLALLLSTGLRMEISVY
jgi:hypothetical protein